MPSNSYLTLLVLALAASTVSPVRCAETRQIEDLAGTSSTPASRVRPYIPTSKTGRLAIGLALLATVISGTIAYNVSGRRRATRAIPPTKTTQPTSPSQPNNPPRAFVGREERDLGRGLPMDTSSSPDARSIKNRDGRAFSSLDLLRRADLRKELILFRRMLDKLD